MFEIAEVPTLNRKKICEGLWKLWIVKKAIKYSLLAKSFKNTVKYIANNMKMNFSNVIFPNKSRASLPQFDAYAYDLVLYECPQQALIKRHQGGGSGMFLIGIIGSTIIKPFQITEGVKLNVQR